MELITTYIGLGSNLGDPIAQIRQAAAELLRRGVLVAPIRKSSLYRTPPWGDVTDQPWFINAVVSGQTSLSPAQLLAAVKAIEKDLGRSLDAPQRWGPRLIDLDIVLYGDQVIDTPDLTIPHPQLIHRAFVLVPLLEISPTLCNPRTGLPLRQYLDLLADQASTFEKITDVW